MAFKYLASPYSHPDAAIRQRRYEEADRATAWLIERKVWTFSPIVHCHHMGLIHDFPTEFVFWEHYNRAMLGQANELLILVIDGWRNSIGVMEERKIAREARIPARLIVPAPTPPTYIFTSLASLT